MVDSNVNGSFTFIHDNQNNTIIPTCVAFSEMGEAFIGQSARDLFHTQPQRAICNLENTLRNRTDNPVAEPDEGLNDIILPTVNVKVEGGLKTSTPEELVGVFFQGLKEMAEDFTGQKVSNVIVSVGLTSTDSEKV